MKNKNQKSAQDKQDEIFRKMSASQKVELTFKIINRVFTIAKTEIKLKYPQLNKLASAYRLHGYLELNRKHFDKLFNQILEKEILKY